MKKIMLVDDVEIANFILKKQIANQGLSVQVHDFTDPVKAFDAIGTIGPDLIFLDINMPVMDGFEFLAKMEEAGNLVPVVMLTSSTSEIDREKALGYSNVNSFCTKPMAGPQLSSILHAL